ncbi:MAG TPA: hypothetical protein VG326_19670 [Tepidisphaeraceae bacterium]|jgi:hypothetical protein|nr:hypothetical protein [Tepidisphaeraceae bacterium]
MLDKKTFTIGVLTLSAVILAVANILAPSPVTASYNSVKDNSDFQMQTATAVGGGDALYVTEGRSGIMAVFTFDPTRKTLLLQDAQPVQNAFAKAISNLKR